MEEKAISNIVLEAEMVAYNEANDLIDEFAYIPECAGFASAGPVAAKMKYVYVVNDAQPLSESRNSPDLLDSSQTTSRSSTQTPERHLAIVLFDLLILNGKSLVFEPYEKRRQILESVIRPIDGHVSFASILHSYRMLTILIAGYACRTHLYRFRNIIAEGCVRGALPSGLHSIRVRLSIMVAAHEELRQMYSGSTR